MAWLYSLEGKGGGGSMWYSKKKKNAVFTPTRNLFYLCFIPGTGWMQALTPRSGKSIRIIILNKLTQCVRKENILWQEPITKDGITLREVNWIANACWSRTRWPLAMTHFHNGWKGTLPPFSPNKKWEEFRNLKSTHSNNGRFFHVNVLIVKRPLHCWWVFPGEWVSYGKAQHHNCRHLK